MSSFAQTSGNPAGLAGRVKGVVQENNKPVKYANVFLTSKNDTTKIVAGTVTDSLGRFLLDKLPIDKYLVNIQIIGYTSKQVPVSIIAFDQQIDLGEIRIETDALLLNAVEVTAMRNLIQKTEEGFVVNAADNITQIGGTAADLLKNMPGVLLGADGEITLRGKSPLTLINGRISGIAGMDRSARLERIPASSIDRIEIINNPSAKYDADAEGGIINIILKKSEGSGTNGAFAVGVGLGDRYRLNGSILLNHKTDKWNFRNTFFDSWRSLKAVAWFNIDFSISVERGTPIPCVLGLWSLLLLP